MIFTNSRTISKLSDVKKNIIHTLPHQKSFGRSKNATIVQPLPVVKKPKLVWGPAIWFMLHTVAEKVHEKSFHIVRNDILAHILSICSNLPCPSCSMHAKQYLQSIDLNKIRTKEDLKKMLYLFHNEVNKRTGNEEYTYEDLNEKYPKGNLNKILTVFFKVFEDKHASVHMLSNDIHTMRVSQRLKLWFRTNIHHFDI